MLYIICGILLLTNIVTIVVFAARSQKDRQRMEQLEQEQAEREYQIEYDKKKAEIVSLQSQINPHFLYNTLEVIRSEAIINRDMEAAEMAEALANYFRYNISKRKDVVTLGEELDNIDNYISIQKKRFGERISYYVEYHTEESEARMTMIPKLTLQPLVENAIYHGIEKKAKGGTVTVHATVTANRLIIQVEDDGPGMDRQTLEEVERQIAGEQVAASASKGKHGGIALANINQRIKMMYGEEYGLTFSATREVGAEAELTIPYYAE